MLIVPAHLQYSVEGALPETVFELLKGPTSAVPVAFTSVDLLVERLGATQPWAAVSARQYTALMDRLGLGPVHLDPQTNRSARRWAPADLRQYEGMR